jgi:branched-chain amino acid transport system substrate-binding protein
MMKKVDPKAKNVAMLYEDDEFSRSVRDGALQYMKSGGFKVIFESNLPVKRSSNEFGFAILD